MGAGGNLKEQASKLKASVKRGLSEVLKPAGFSASSAGYFRKQISDVTQVVHVCYYLSESDALQYKNSGLAFSIELGVYFDFIPSLCETISVVNPNIADCQIRSVLRKSIDQPQYPNGLVWSANADGSNIQLLVNDAKDVISKRGLEWLAALSQPSVAFLTSTTEKMTREGAWGLGNFGSPLRYLLIAFLAKRLGKEGEAATAFEELKKKNLTGWNIPRLEEALHALRSSDFDST